MTRRRWIADNWTATTAALTGDQAAHLARVLRAERGQVFDVVAGGLLYRGEVTEVSEHQVLFTLHEELASDPALPLHLLLAVFKFDHMEWAIEKVTELGAGRITPVLARRTERHLALAASKRVERWRRIVFEAAKQSRRVDIPEIADPMQLKSALEKETSPICLLLSEAECANTLSGALATSLKSRAATATADKGGRSFCALAIGPEGGWSPEEMSLFTHHHWQHVTLGPRILRVETAAIAAIAIAATHFI